MALPKFAISSLFLLSVCGLAQGRLSEYVDPLIGTEGSTPGSAIAGGNSFPGASLPNAMAKVGIDTSYLGVPNGTAVDCNAGYSPLGNVTAISMLHVSGTGGVPTYGLISQMPLLGGLNSVNLADNTTYWQNRSMGEESAQVGLFQTTLLNGIEIDITSTAHTGLFRYRFPVKSDLVASNNLSTPTIQNEASDDGHSEDAHVLVDLTHVLPGYGTYAYSQKFLHGDLHLREGANGSPSYLGSATYTGGWSQPESQTLYFCGNFTSPNGNLQPSSDYVVQNTRQSVQGAGTFSWPYNPLLPPTYDERPVPRSHNDVLSYAGSGMGIGGLFSWKPTSANTSAERVIEARLGVSYISAQQACANVAAEVPETKSFEDVVEDAKVDWEENVLGTVQVEDNGSQTNSNTTLKRMLYTALYQTGLMELSANLHAPTNKTGENPKWQTDQSNPYYDDHYTLWDTYRTLTPLYHLLYTKTYADVLSGLISIFTNEGFLPAGRIANWNGRVQGGTHADMVLGDAFTKDVVSLSGQRGRGELGSNIDWHEAYKAVLNDAMNLPSRNEDPVAFDGATQEGRGALDDQLSLHYITRNHTRSISRGVEYAQNDYAIYSMAKGLNGSESAAFRDRAGWWENQWNPNANTSLEDVGSFTGFPGARNQDGSWNFTDYDPLSCGGCGWGSDIYEAKVWETAFAAAPHDMAKIVQLMGGDEQFIKRLDASFLPGFGTSVGENNDAGSALFNPGNEPSFMTPFLYNYVPGYHWKTVNQTRATVDAFYGVGRDGFPGNIDGGALPSWLIFNLIGLYPVSAQPIYLLSAPRFETLSIRLFGGTAQETRLNISAPGISDSNYYPQTVTFNGQKLDRSWMTHYELGGGGELVFEMGENPASWDTGERPPSLTAWE
ncbi:hypothetical protein D0869_01759 [Hortaea werneckii]|uniref:Glycosyl hydrolase family 92 domain-containing protein n=1 Tax=Hortaea werneckii TaxID=91943 RepID=A0A3M6Z3Q6_HORWE|nr:hypothetical protein D0869_01759 [Hortaea werneckii]RMY07946.1 hypothetical protein D0868_05080 [Hortaea werneckii]RMY09976.1 hypothetical protein D0867_08551 [Hortaea werneckii]